MWSRRPLWTLSTGPLRFHGPRLRTNYLKRTFFLVIMLYIIMFFLNFDWLKTFNILKFVTPVSLVIVSSQAKPQPWNRFKTILVQSGVVFVGLVLNVCLFEEANLQVFCSTICCLSFVRHSLATSFAFGCFFFNSTKVV